VGAQALINRYWDWKAALNRFTIQFEDRMDNV
jgi:hypothetical protein